MPAPALRLIGRLVLGLAAALGVVSAHELTGQQQVAADAGRIHGRVVAADTGVVIRGAQVILTASDGTRWIAVTDDEGLFDVRNLPPSGFNLRIAKAGFVDAALSGVDLKRVAVSDRGDIALVRGGVIYGRLLDHFGEPVVNATVGAARLVYRTPGNPMTRSAQTAVTNDLGEFRIFGLEAGSYYVFGGFGGVKVSAAAGAGEAGVTYASAGVSPVLTYFPGSPRLADAQPVLVGSGEGTYAGFRMIAVAPIKLSGRVVDSRSEPARRMMIMVTAPRDESNLVFRAQAVEVDDQGAFVVHSLPPGEYRLDVVARSALEALGQAGSTATAKQSLGEFASLQVSATGDIHNLLIQTSTGFTVHGRVSVDGAPPPVSWLKTLQISAFAGTPLLSSSTEVASDGSFILRGVVGERGLGVRGLPANATLDRVLAGGTDITERGLVVDRDTAGIQIHVTATPTVVSGRVTDEQGTAVQADVIVYSEDSARWDSPRFLQFARGDSQQGFRIQGLQPGRYLAVAVQDLDELDWANPSRLERLRADATTFSLAKGETRVLTLIRK